MKSGEINKQFSNYKIHHAFSVKDKNMFCFSNKIIIQEFYCTNFIQLFASIDITCILVRPDLKKETHILLYIYSESFFLSTKKTKDSTK